MQTDVGDIWHLTKSERNLRLRPWRHECLIEKNLHDQTVALWALISKSFDLNNISHHTQEKERRANHYPWKQQMYCSAFYHISGNATLLFYLLFRICSWWKPFIIKHEQEILQMIFVPYNFVLLINIFKLHPNYVFTYRKGRLCFAKRVSVILFTEGSASRGWVGTSRCWHLVATTRMECILV